jgi:hypothetical protein
MTVWPPRVRVGRRPRLTDSELLTLATAQALLGVRSEARWLRLVPAALPGAFPYLPGQSGHNKRLRAALPLLKRLIRELAADTDLWTDPVWLVDSTPVECARSRPAVRRSALAGVAGYGYCPSHSRWYRGLRLHLICTPAGLPITWALAPPRHDDRQVLMCVLDADADLVADRPGLLLLADKNYISADLDDHLHRRGPALLRPSSRHLTPRPGQHLLAPVQQLIESVYDTPEGQLDLELHGGRTLAGVTARVAQRLLALTAAIWHNRAHRPAHHPIPDRLRPLTDFGLAHLVGRWVGVGCTDGGADRPRPGVRLPDRPDAPDVGRPPSSVQTTVRTQWLAPEGRTFPPRVRRVGGPHHPASNAIAGVRADHRCTARVGRRHFAGEPINHGSCASRFVTSR